MSSPHVFDVTAASFQDVVRRSTQVPVLLEFWADWCGPCKTLAPVLESVADAYGGAFVVGKVDTEKERDLAAAFRVQSIPFGVLIAEGRPVDAFSGALPERELRAFLARAGIEPAAGAEPEPAVQDPDSPPARLATAKRSIARGDVVAARAALDAIPDEADEATERDRLRDGLALFEVEPGASPAAEPLVRAREHIVGRRLEAAMDEILRSIELDRGFRDGVARKAMVLCFALRGENDEVSGDYRRRMATLLY